MDCISINITEQTINIVIDHITTNYLYNNFLALSGGTLTGDVKSLSSFQFGNDTNNLSIDNEGFIKLNGSSTLFDDLRFDFSTTKVGANNRPATDFDDLGLIFNDNREDDIVYIVAQFPHNRKLNSSVFPHIHFIQTSNNLPTFVLEYRWYSNGANVPSQWTTLTSTGVEFDYIGGSMLNVLIFPEIQDPTPQSLSSFMDIKIYRQSGDALVGSVLYKEFDIHYEIDKMGSNNQYEPE